MQRVDISMYGTNYIHMFQQMNAADEELTTSYQTAFPTNHWNSFRFLKLKV